MKKKSPNITNKTYGPAGKFWSVSAIAGILILWQIISAFGIVDAFLLPSPVQVIKAFVSEFPALMEHSVITLTEAFLGLLIGIGLGFVMAVLMDHFDFLYKAFYPLMIQGEKMSLVINITSEAGSISKCYRTNLIDYGMAKAALNMGTMNLVNVFKDDERINIFCVHPGWIRTDGKPDNQAPLSSYDAAEILRKLFEEKRYDKTGPRFITNEGEEYPF